VPPIAVASPHVVLGIGNGNDFGRHAVRIQG
jgi:hypothetical protein